MSGPILTIRLPGTSTWIDYSDFLIIGNQGGGSDIGGGGGVSNSVSSILTDSPCTKIHQLNSPPQLAFVLGPDLDNPGAFVKPPRYSEVRLDTTEFPGFFTGFITNEPAAEPLGQNAINDTAILGFHYAGIGEEILLDMNAIGVIAPFTGKLDGQIIAELIAHLLPPTGSPPVSRFDTSGITSFGNLNAIFTVQPQERFSAVVNRLLANQSVKLYFKRGVAYLSRLNDGVIYAADEDNDTFFNPFDLSVSPVPTSIRNDLTGFGAIERKEYAKEYFVADGVTANYPLKLPVFGATGAKLFADDFSAAAIDLTHWVIPNDTGVFSMFGGSLNIVGGSGLNTTKMYLNQGIEVKGSHKLHGGEFRFVGGQNGIVAGLYSSQTMTLANCTFGFRLNAVSSPASQTSIQAIVNGGLIGTTIFTQSGKSYAFHIYIDSQINARSWRPWYSLKNSFGGGIQNGDFLVTFVVEENDQLQVKAPTKYQLYQTIINNSSSGSPATPSMPVFLFIGLASVVDMNCAVNFFSVTEPIQMALQITEPSLHGSPPVAITRRGTMGFIGETDADATIQLANAASVLSFFQETRLPAQYLIEASYRGSGLAVARVISQASITAQAAAFGDSGVRADVMTGILPLPASSELLESALQAFLDDSINPQFDGDWTLLYPPHAPLSTIGSPPVAEEPIPGRFIRVTSPKRLGTLTSFDALVKVVQTDIVTCDQGSPVTSQYLWKLSYGEIATEHMDEILQRFTAKPVPAEVLSYNPTSTIGAVDTTAIATQFVDDLPDVKLVGRTSTGSPPKYQYVMDGRLQLSSGQFYEVRWSDANWGQDGLNLIGRFAGTTIATGTGTGPTLQQEAIDNYNRVNSSPISPNWTTTSGLNNIRLISGSSSPASTSIWCGAFWNSIAFTANQYAEITIGGLNAAGTTFFNGLTGVNTWAGPVVRAGPSQFGYMAAVNGPTNGTCLIRICKVADPATFLATFTATVNTGDSIRIEAIGTAISVYKNGTLVGSVTDSTFAGGAPGVAQFSNLTVNDSSILLFAGGNIVPVGETVEAVDDFVGSNANPIGGNWTTLTGFAAIQRLSNKAENTNFVSVANIGNVAYWNANTFPSDHYAEVTIGPLATNNVDWAGAVVRANPATGTGYVAIVNRPISPSNFATVKLMRLDGASIAVVSLGIYANIPDGDNTTVRLSVVGNQLTVSTGGVVRMVATDNNYTGGSPGIYLESNHAADGSSIKHFIAGNIIGGAGAGGTEFAIDRIRRDEWVYVKLLDTNFSPYRLSRHPAFVRIVYPMVPLAPQLKSFDGLDNKNPIFSFELAPGAFLSDVYQLEIRDVDDITVLDTIEINTEGDMIYVHPNPTGALTVTINAYFVNLLGEYSARLNTAGNLETSLLTPLAVGSNQLSNPGFEVSTGTYPLTDVAATEQLLADNWYASIVTTPQPFLMSVEKNIPLSPPTARSGGRNAHITLDRSLTSLASGLSVEAILSQIKNILSTPGAAKGAVPVVGGDTYYYGGWCRWDADSAFGSPLATGTIFLISKSGNIIGVIMNSALGLLDGTAVEISGTFDLGADYDGVYYEGITNIDAVTFFVVANDYSVQPTLFGGTVTSPGDAIAYVGFQVVFWDTDGLLVSATFGTGPLFASQPDVIIDANNAWQHLSGLTDVPASAAFATFHPFVLLDTFNTINPSLHNYLDVRFDDVFFEKANRGTHSDYAIVGDIDSNPLLAHDDGGASLDEIDISSLACQSGGLTAHYNSGVILLCQRKTRYFVYFDDPGFTGGTVAFHATVDEVIAKLGENRFFVGSIYTPDAGQADTIGNGDGGHGSAPGAQTLGYFQPVPTSFFLAFTIVNTGSSVTDPMNAIDPDPTTFATLSGTGAGAGEGQAALNLQVGPAISRRFQKITIYVEYEVTANSVTANGSPITVAANFSALKLLNQSGSTASITGASVASVAYSTGALSRRTAKLVIPADFNLALLIVSIVILPGNFPDTTQLGTMTMKIYKVWIIGEGG